MTHTEDSQQPLPPSELAVMDEASPLRSFGFRYLEVLRATHPERSHVLRREGRLLERALEMEAEAETIYRSGMEALRARGVSPMEATELLSSMIEDHFLASERA